MRFRAFLALVPLLAVLAAPAQAQRDGETLDRILPEIRAAHPGRLSDAQPWTDDSGGTHYKIKWMTPEGRILYFDADARTGHFSNSVGEDGGRWRGGLHNSGGGSGGVDRQTPPPSEDRGRHHDNWNGSSSAGGADWSVRNGGDWRDRSGGGDWRDRTGGDWRNRGGDWRGGHGAGDTGGWHHDGRGGH